LQAIQDKLAKLNADLVDKKIFVGVAVVTFKVVVLFKVLKAVVLEINVVAVIVFAR
jgi:hypothetical protein